MVLKPILNIKNWFRKKFEFSHMYTWNKCRELWKHLCKDLYIKFQFCSLLYLWITDMLNSAFHLSILIFLAVDSIPNRYSPRNAQHIHCNFSFSHFKCKKGGPILSLKNVTKILQGRSRHGQDIFFFLKAVVVIQREWNYRVCGSYRIKAYL